MLCSIEFCFREVSEVVTELNRVQNNIRKVESSLESPEEVKQKYRQSKDKFISVTDIMHHLDESIKELHSAIIKRKHYYENIEDYFVNYINHNFSKVLDFRQFKVI